MPMCGQELAFSSGRGTEEKGDPCPGQLFSTCQPWKFMELTGVRRQNPSTLHWHPILHPCHQSQHTTTPAFITMLCSSSLPTPRRRAELQEQTRPGLARVSGMQSPLPADGWLAVCGALCGTEGLSHLSLCQAKGQASDFKSFGKLSNLLQINPVHLTRCRLRICGGVFKIGSTRQHKARQDVYHRAAAERWRNHHSTVSVSHPSLHLPPSQAILQGPPSPDKATPVYPAPSQSQSTLL